MYATRSTGSSGRDQILKITRSRETFTCASDVAAREFEPVPQRRAHPVRTGPGMLYAIVGDGHDSADAQNWVATSAGRSCA